jgi:hypothetical protein
MCAAFPRSDYYGGSALRPRHDRTCRPAGLRGPDARIEVPMFKEETLGAVGGRLYPWQRGPHAKSGHGGGVPIPVHPVLLSVATELWLHTSHLRVQAPYREIQTPSSTRGVFARWLHLGTFGNPPREPLLLCGQLRPLGYCRSPFQSRRRSRSPSAPGPTRARMTMLWSSVPPSLHGTPRAASVGGWPTPPPSAWTIFSRASLFASGS